MTFTDIYRISVTKLVLGIAPFIIWTSSLSVFIVMGLLELMGILTISPLWLVSPLLIGAPLALILIVISKILELTR